MDQKTLESPLNCKDIQPVHPKGNQCRVFIGSTDAEADRWCATRLPSSRKDKMERKRSSPATPFQEWRLHKQ
ncbi:hypothetical protein CapIbe_022102 [Capra ibex]